MSAYFLIFLFLVILDACFVFRLIWVANRHYEILNQQHETMLRAINRTHEDSFALAKRDNELLVQHMEEA